MNHPAGGLRIAPDDPRADDVRALLAAHLDFARQVTRPDEVHALDVDGLVADAVSFFSGRIEGTLVAVGALRRLDAEHAEVKSMHTTLEARGQGIGRAMLEHLVGVARDRGCRRVSLETGMMPAFAPARSLYIAYGFEPCAPFGTYRPSPNSVCMTLDLLT